MHMSKDRENRAAAVLNVLNTVRPKNNVNGIE